MQNPNNIAAQVNPTEPPEPTEPAQPAPQDEPRLPWHVVVSQYLAQAARLCAKHGVELEAFMSGAWSAYMEARPGMRDQLEEAQLREQLDELRQAGRVGLA